MKRIAVLGAAGFVGNRCVEMLHLGGRADVVPIVRRAAALALCSRFGLSGRIADAQREDMLAEALAGCEAVICCVAGPPATITGMCAPLVRAAARIGLRRIVYLSSQMVHGQSLLPGTTEDSPISYRQPFRYNRAKAKAEQLLGSLASAEGVELMILRPGIVYGPRSRWTGGVADDLLTGEAFLLADGGGACNGVYVDNLVHAIELALEAPAVSNPAFFINDAEDLSWADLILPIADALRLGPDAIRRPTLEEALELSRSSLRDHLEGVARSAVRRLPRGMAQVVRRLRAAATSGTGAGAAKARLSREITLLQANGVHLSNEKAGRLLGYRPTCSHAEGMRRSISWLQFAGYPAR